MNSYEAKLEARRVRLEAAADAAERRASAAYKRADLREEVSGIPLGQPILVGHHSESRHRNAIKRADNAMRRSVEESKKAGEYRAKAASVGSGGISSDDPEALDKLAAKLAKKEANQVFMREANKVIRAFYKAGVRDANSGAYWDRYLARLAEKTGRQWSAAEACAALQPDFAGRIGFADYQLSNNNAEISRIKKRIAQLERAAKAEPKEAEYQGLCKVVENVEENRVQIIFDGKPSADVRSVLKSNGFRWSRYNMAWQRHLNNAGRWAAERVIKELSE